MTAAAPVASAASPVAAWRDVLVLLKLRIDALIVAVAVVGAVAAGERSGARLLVLAAATFAAAAGAGALNHYLDRDLDRRMGRTASRPLAAGRLRPSVALTLGVGLIAASTLAAPELGPAANLYLLAGAATYVLLYTAWLKRRTPYSIVWGGAAGSFAALAGWQVAGSTFAPEPQLLAVVLFLWTPSHFWSLAMKLEDDYRAAGVPMLPVVAGAARTARAVLANTLMLAALTLALGVFLGWPYLVVAAPAALGFAVECVRLSRAPTRSQAFRVFKLSGLYLLAVLAGVVVASLV